MAFKLTKIVGNGSLQDAVNNTVNEESVVHSLVAYNSTGGVLSFSVIINSTVVYQEKVTANSVFRMTDKLNIMAGKTAKILAPVGLELTVNYLQQVIDESAAMTVVEQAVVDATTQVNLATAQRQLAEQAVIDADMAASSANNKGNWSALTGSLDIPASVNHNNKIWVLNVYIPDITLSEPSRDNTDYTIVAGGIESDIELSSKPVLGLIHNWSDDVYRRVGLNINTYLVDGINEFSSWKTNSSERQNTNDVGIPSPFTKYLNDTPNLPYSSLKRKVINTDGIEVKDFKADSYAHEDLTGLLTTQQVMTKMRECHYIDAVVIDGGKEYVLRFIANELFSINLENLGFKNINSINVAANPNMSSGIVLGNTITSVLHPAFDTKSGNVDKRYYGSFEAVSGRSICGLGIKATTNITRTAARTSVQGFGVKFTQLDWFIRSLLVHMAIIESGTWYMERSGVSANNKWEGCSGIGGTSNPYDNGLTLALGDTTGVILNGSNQVIANSYRGIENWHSHLYNWCDGININNYKVHLAKPHSIFNDTELTTGDYYDSGLLVPAAMSASYLGRLHTGTIIPKDTTGSITTKVTDAGYSATGLMALRLGGPLNIAGDSGAASWHSLFAASYSVWNICARSVR